MADPTMNPKNAPQALLDAVLAAIPADHPSSVGEIAAAVGREPSSIAPALRALHDRGSLVSSPEGWRRVVAL